MISQSIWENYGDHSRTVLFFVNNADSFLYRLQLLLQMQEEYFRKTVLPINEKH